MCQETVSDIVNSIDNGGGGSASEFMSGIVAQVRYNLLIQDYNQWQGEGEFWVSLSTSKKFLGLFHKNISSVNIFLSLVVGFISK